MYICVYIHICVYLHKKTQVVKERHALIFCRYLWLFVQSLQTAAKSILVRLSTYTFVSICICICI